MKIPPPIVQYLTNNPDKSVFDYLEEFGMQAWNDNVVPYIREKLQNDIWPRGQALIGYDKEYNKVIWRYRDDRIETESINELFVLGRIGDKLITDVTKLIFKIGDKVFIAGQYGVIKGISQNYIDVEETEIGSIYEVNVEGIDLDKFVTL